MPMHPMRYAELLGEKLDKHDSQVWLINTGWTGGPYGIGKRMPIKHTRAMVNAALDGKLDEVVTDQERFFGLHVPLHCPGVPDDVLNPRNTWADLEEYDAQAKKLAGMFAKNFEQFSGQTSEEIRLAGPVS